MIVQELSNFFEVGISVKTIQEVSQHMMTELILILDKICQNDDCPW